MCGHLLQGLMKSFKVLFSRITVVWEKRLIFTLEQHKNGCAVLHGIAAVFVLALPENESP
ncbi:hypothetical protein AMQ83_30320 [Paenibacillus riograndensis]|nr:hypothetical protein AMQ83_30320 [Paenibacillus riograndensis]